MVNEIEMDEKMKQYKQFTTLKEINALFFRKNPQVNPSEINGFKINQCHHANSLTLASKIVPNSCDSVVADPPFAIENGEPETANYNRTSSNVLKGYNEINVKDYYDFSKTWLKNAYSILRKKGNLILVSGWTNQRDVLNALYENNFYIQSQIIWRYNFGVFTKKRAVSSHYNIFFCSKHKNDFTFNKLLWYMEDVMDSDEFPIVSLDIPREYWTNKTKTPNKLPKELAEMLIAMGTIQNDLVIDMFSGSGTFLKVCNQMKRDCLAFDIVKEYVDFANYRLKELNY